MSDKKTFKNTATLNVPIIFRDELVSSVLDKMPQFAQECESIDYFYVVDSEKKLVGVVSFKELIRGGQKGAISELMKKKLVVSHAHTSKKRIAHLAVRHNIKAVPIVNEMNQLIGVFTNDTIFSILYHEHKKELYQSAGIITYSETFDTILDQGIRKAFVARLPWIIVGLLGGIFAAQIVAFFEGTLAENVILAAFIPLIVYISDAVGTQTQTFFVRDIAFHPKIDIVAYSIKQFITTTLIGIICGGLVFVIVSLFWNSLFFGLVIGLSTFMAIASSTIIAIAIPHFLSLLKQDPASGSGPFATILQDLFSIFIYFLIASVLLK